LSISIPLLNILNNIIQDILTIGHPCPQKRNLFSPNPTMGYKCLITAYKIIKYPPGALGEFKLVKDFYHPGII
jgi:hypothetical protein